jgi:hypothetical protein
VIGRRGEGVEMQIWRPFRDVCRVEAPTRKGRLFGTLHGRRITRI